MTGSRITGTVTQTVVLGTSQYPSPLTVALTGVVHPTAYGTTGIYAPSGLSSVSIINRGEVFGADGASGFGFDSSSSSGIVLAGGIGIDLQSTAALKNSGTISGGYGGYVNRSVSYAGGDAVVFSAGGYVSNTGSILGGVGGYAYYGPAEVGGVGVDISSVGTLINNGLIQGGQGGLESEGGSGGYGVIMAAGTLINHGKITGGEGGSAAQEDSLGGKGGAGVSFSGQATVVNSGVISGARGGGGQFASEANGGAGINLSVGGILSNSGTVVGGNSAAAVLFGGEGALSNSGVIDGGTAGFTFYSSSTGGVGTDMPDGGILSNTGTIAGGYSAAAVLFGGNGTVINNGVIAGGGAVYNKFYNSSGPGGIGLDISAGSQATLVNSGSIVGGDLGGGSGSPSSGVGVYLGGRDSFTDRGSIVGGAGGFNKYHQSGAGGIGLAVVGASNITVTIDGSIAGGSGGISQYYYGGNGGVGVYLNGGTLSVAGTITGGAAGYSYGQAGLDGDAVQFGTLAATLSMTSKAVFHGDIVADSAVDDTLVLEAQGAGTLSGLGSTVTGFTTIDEAANANWTLRGSITGTGAIDIHRGAKLILDGAVSIATIGFAGAADLILDTPAEVTSTFTHFSTGDTIRLVGIKADSLTFKSGTLTLLNASNAVVDTLAFSGKHTASDFALQPDGKGTEIVSTASASLAQGLLQDFQPGATAPAATYATMSARQEDAHGASHMATVSSFELPQPWHGHILSAG